MSPNTRGSAGGPDSPGRSPHEWAIETLPGRTSGAALITVRTVERGEEMSTRSPSATPHASRSLGWAWAYDVPSLARSFSISRPLELNTPFRRRDVIRAVCTSGS